MIFHTIIDTMLPNRRQQEKRYERVMPIELPGRQKTEIEFPVPMPLKQFPGLEETLDPREAFITEIDFTRPAEIQMPEDRHALYIIA